MRAIGRYIRRLEVCRIELWWVGLTPLWSADHLPLKGGDRQDGPPMRNSQRPTRAIESHRSISPLEGEMSGRTEGGELHPPTFR